jgi:hypothetical protein
MNFFQRRSILKNANCLNLRPVRIVKEEITDDGRVTTLFPKFTSKLAQKYIVPRLKFPYVKIKLDELGSAAWLLMDGNASVGEISKKLEDKFNAQTCEHCCFNQQECDKKAQLGTSEIEERLVKFISMLYEEKLISFTELLLAI